MARTKVKKKNTRTSGRAKAAAKPVKRKTIARAKARTAGPSARTRSKRPTARSGTSDAMRAFAQRIIDVTRTDDDDEILALYAVDVESSEAGQPPMIGHDALRNKFAGWRSMVTDTSFEPRRVLVDGNVIMIEWLGRVTLQASGRRAELSEVAVHEIRDGKIVREASYYNPAVLA